MRKFFKWVLIIFVVLVVIGVIAGNGKDQKESAQTSAAPAPAATQAAAAPRKPAPAKPGKEVVTVTANELQQAYDENEVAADELMKGKIIAVSGTVQSIDKNFMDSVVIQLKTKNEFMPASMTMERSEKEAAMKLRKGQKVVIRCENMNKIMGSPAGSDCVFQ
ncbi:hypothetical protein DQD89_07360 [Salmonella enterica subsp. enterica]|nr:hypothetical protein [Salmonella enterica subsp. enterica serovar Kedougou]